MKALIAASGLMPGDAMVLESIAPQRWLDRLNVALAKQEDASRSISETGDAVYRYLLDAGRPVRQARADADAICRIMVGRLAWPEA